MAATPPQVVRMGHVRIRSFAGWAWRLKSLVLTNEALLIPGLNKIPLDHITKVERVDLKPYCLLLQSKNLTYHLSFTSDEELYDWQDDVYSRCPLIGAGSPSGFTHNVHVGFDEISSTLPSQWDALIHKTDQDKPINDPARPSAILDGHLSIKTDGFFSGWRWLPRWIVLRPKTLTIYQSQTSLGGLTIHLSDITHVQVTPRSRRLRIHTRTGKRYSLSFRRAEEAYTWRDAISPRITNSTRVVTVRRKGKGKEGGDEISHPWGFVHRLHVGFDRGTGEFIGLPESWKHLVQPPPHATSTSTSS